MAIQNFNTGKNTGKGSVPIKETAATREIVAANLGKNNIDGTIRSFETGSFEKVALEPAVDFINSYKLNKKSIVNCIVKTDVVSWRLGDGIIGLSRNDIIDGLRNLDERLRGVEVRDRLNADLMIRGFKSFFDSFVRNEGGLKAEITPDGYIKITYYGEGGTVNTNIKPNLSGSDIVRYSYDLKRKETNGSDWVDINSCNNVTCPIVEWDKKMLRLNTQYTYRIKVKNLKTNKEKEYDVDILYKALDVEIADFTAEPDPIERRVNFRCDVKNCTDTKIVRKDTNKEFEISDCDSNVEAGKKYGYVLYASNAWYKNVKKEAVADCTNVKPTAGKLTYQMKDSVRGVVLSMETIKNGFVSAIERHDPGTPENEWVTLEPAANQQNCDEVRPISNQKNYSDYEKTLYPGEILKVGKTYRYRARYSNYWGKDLSTYSDPVSVKMVNKYALPHMPRILQPKYAGETIRWTTSDRATSYVVKRYDKSNEKDFYKIEQDTETYNNRWPEEGKIEVFSSIKDQIQNNVQYLYKITARNAWGEAVSYQDVFLPEKTKGENDVNCYKYKGQNTNDANHSINFQGITTDGQWWYLINGVPYWVDDDPCKTEHRSYVYLRKAAVDSSLDRNVSEDYEFPARAHAGDLDCFGDYLFVPVYKDTEGDRAEIWIFDKDLPKDEERITTEVLSTKNGEVLTSCAWCAVNPCDKRLYTSYSNFYNGIIYSYKINFDNIRRTKNGEKGLRIFSDPVEVHLFDDGKIFRDNELYDKPNDENRFIFAKESMQGGCFDYYNNLYLNSGFKKPAKLNSGIQVFKLICDEELTIRNVLSSATNDEERAKNYEAYQSGNWDGSCSYKSAVLVARSVQKGDFQYQFNVKDDEEPEGLVYCDFNYTPQTPPEEQKNIKYGSFHASLLKNSDNVDWEYMWFKHYQHLYRETVEKHVSYSNLFVLIDYVRGGYKIVDNGVLVKRFKTSEAANKAVNVLKNFRKDTRTGEVIYTIGWLCTSDSNHNYEFTALRRDEKPSLEDMADWKVEYDPQKIIVFGNKEGDPLERYLIRLEDNDGKCYHFLAHNEKDADRIQNILKDYKKICIVGVGPDSEDKNYFSEKKCGCRIRSEYNLIWLEK